MTLWRHILRPHAAPFAFSIIVLIAIFVLQFIMKFMDKLVGKGLSSGIIIEMIVLNLAWMVVLAVPMSVLIATLMAFGGLASTNEVTAMRASGVSLYRMMMPGELKDGEVREYVVHPRQFGLQAAPLAAVQVSDVQQSRAMLLQVLANEAGPARDIVALNAGAAIYACGLAESMERGVEKALTLIASSAARRKLDQFVAFTHALKS